MATRVTRRNLFRGFSSIDRQPRQSKLHDIELIKRDLLNHFHTRRGERVMYPNFGSIVWDLLFEPLDANNQALIVQDVERICALDTRVEVADVMVYESEHGLRVHAELVFRPYDIVDNMVADFDRRNVERT